MAETPGKASKGKPSASGASKAPTEPAKPAAESSEPTQRVVLAHVPVLVLPEGGITTEQLIAAHKALGGKGTPDERAAWIECGVFEGASRDHSIEAYAGKAGTPDAKIGTFKAVPVKSFAGGIRHKAPPKPLVEKEAID